MDLFSKVRGMFAKTPQTEQSNVDENYIGTLDKYLEKGNVNQAISLMTNHSERAVANLQQYDVETHKINSRPKKMIYDKDGNFLRDKDLNRITIPYQKYINEIALVFIYGRPPKWTNATPNPFAKERKELAEQIDTLESDSKERNTMQARIDEIDSISEKNDMKFDNFTRLIHDSRFNAHIREAKRYAGCEGTSAMLFHTYQQDGKPQMLIKVLAKSKKDNIYTLFDQYERLVCFAWGYDTLDSGRKTIHHYEIYKSDVIYHCQQVNGGRWQVEKDNNPIGKIPVIFFEQEVEWNGVQSIIERIELAMSKNADTNDNFSDPALVATSDIVNTLPKQEEESRLYVLRNGGDIKYLERSNTNQARNDEISTLEEQALTKSFTPNITLDELKGLSNASGATLRQIMMLANIKADKRKETHDGYLSRTSNLLCAILQNVLDVAGGNYTDLVIAHEFQEPFGADLTTILSDVLRQFGAGAMSLQTALEQSYLIANPDKEIEQMNKEKALAAAEQEQNMMDIFSRAE
jgi:SPP1 family phage portal protein